MPPLYLLNIILLNICLLHQCGTNLGPVWLAEVWPLPRLMSVCAVESLLTTKNTEQSCCFISTTSLCPFLVSSSNHQPVVEIMSQGYRHKARRQWWQRQKRSVHHKSILHKAIFHHTNSTQHSKCHIGSKQTQPSVKITNKWKMSDRPIYVPGWLMKLYNHVQLAN